MSLCVEESENYALIKLPPSLDELTRREIAPTLERLSKARLALVLLDFSQMSTLDSTLSRPVAQLSLFLKREGRFLASIGMSKSIVDEVTRAGLDKAYGPCGNVAQALQLAGIAPVASAEPVTRPRLDVNFINPFIKATLNTIGTQGNIALQAQKPFLKPKNEQYLADMGGVIAIQSDGFEGVIGILFPNIVLQQIYSAMLGEPAAPGAEPMDPKVLQDSAAELLNMIFGQAKAELNEQKGYRIKSAIPRVLTSVDLAEFGKGSAATLVVPFELGGGVFRIEVSVGAVPAAGAA